MQISSLSGDFDDLNDASSLEAWRHRRLAAWMVILQPEAWRLGGTGSLDAGGNGRLGVLAVWMLVARMMRVGIRILMNDDRDESWKEVGRNSHTLGLRGARRMTGSTGTVLDVMVNAIVSNGKMVWEPGGERFTQIRPCGSSAL